MSEMESKAALWHRKEEFRAIWGNPDSLRPLGRSNMSQLLLLYTLSRVLANCPQRCWRVSVLTLAERETAREMSGKETLSSSLSHLPSLKVALERVYSSHNLQSVFLALSLKQKPQRPLGDFIPTIYSPSQNLQEKSDALAR